MTRTIFFGLLTAVVAVSCIACRRENPALARATATAVVEATVTAGRPIATSRHAKVAAGNLGVAATGISAGIQLWSRPGGVMAGGATMTGTVTDGAEVDVIGEADFLGQKYFQIRDSSKAGWIDGRFLRLD